MGVNLVDFKTNRRFPVYKGPYGSISCFTSYLHGRSGRKPAPAFSTLPPSMAVVCRERASLYGCNLLEQRRSSCRGARNDHISHLTSHISHLTSHISHLTSHIPPIHSLLKASILSHCFSAIKSGATIHEPPTQRTLGRFR